MFLLRVVNMEMIKFSLLCKYMKWLVSIVVFFLYEYGCLIFRFFLLNSEYGFFVEIYIVYVFICSLEYY